MKIKDISTMVGDISLDTKVLTAQNRFCQIWPTVKEGLQLLANAVNNAVVKFAINTLITAADGIFNSTCGQQSQTQPQTKI